MARKTITVSDLSGKTVADSELARVTIDHGSKRFIVDALFEEVQELTKAGRKIDRPGRKAKVA